jgi:hypothetical protein
MNDKLKIEIKDVYGVKRIYPACDTSKLLVQLKKKDKTFNNEDIAILKQLGFTIEIQTPTI